MMLTLLKHEWMRTRSLLGTVVGLAALTALLATLLAATGWPLLSTLGIGVATIVIFALAPVLQVALTADYWRSSYSRTGYFTHSLPLRGATIYTAKLLWAATVTLAALAATAVLGGIFWWGAAGQLGVEPNPFIALGNAWALVNEAASPGMVVAVALALLALYLAWPIQYYFAVSVGNESRLNRFGLGGPVLAFVGVYMVTQVASMLGMLALPLGLGMREGQLSLTTFNFISEMSADAGVSNEVMPLGFLPPLIVIAALCLWRTVHSWNRRVALV